MIDFIKTPEVIAAIIAAITSVITLGLTLLTKNFIEKSLLIFKLDSEYKFEQRKKIKNVLALNKGHLLTACENLNHRLWNSSKENHLKWMEVNGVYNNPNNYYFHSFVYRILNVYAWMSKIESELIHLDTTIATSDDLDFMVGYFLMLHFLGDLSMIATMKQITSSKTILMNYIIISLVKMN